MGKRLKKKRYIKGLDGIRAIAVVAVILYHLAPFSFQGGFLGVPIFFVVSGYLITDLLFQEFQQNGTIDVKAFYIRRINGFIQDWLQWFCQRPHISLCFQEDWLKI